MMEILNFNLYRKLRKIKWILWFSTNQTRFDIYVLRDTCQAPGVINILSVTNIHCLSLNKYLSKRMQLVCNDSLTWVFILNWTFRGNDTVCPDFNRSFASVCWLCWHSLSTSVPPSVKWRTSQYMSSLED